MITAILGLLASAFFVWFGFALHGWADSRREDRAFKSHFDALGMEIRRCGQLAATYLDDNVESPLYRLPCDAYRLALPVLFGVGLVTGDQADTFQKFYLQAEQVNRGLDNVDDFLRGNTPENEGQAITLALEQNRLTGKARDMRAQGAGNDAAVLYNDAVTALNTVFKAWYDRSLWRRFKKRWVRPILHRVKLLLKYPRKLLARLKKS